MDGRTAIHTISFAATPEKDSTKYDEHTGKDLLRIPQTVDQKTLFERVTKLLSRLPHTKAYSKVSNSFSTYFSSSLNNVQLNPHEAFYFHLKDELSKLRIPMEETDRGEKFGRGGIEMMVLRAEETNVLVRKSQPRSADAQTLPVRTREEIDKRKQEKRPERKIPEKQQASADSQSEAKTKPSRSNDHSPHRDSNKAAGPSNTKGKVVDIDESQPTAEPSNHRRRTISQDTHAKLLKSLQMTSYVPTESSSTPKKDNPRRTEPVKASKPRSRDHRKGSEDEEHSSSDERRRKERKRRGDKA